MPFARISFKLPSPSRGSVCLRGTTPSPFSYPSQFPQKCLPCLRRRIGQALQPASNASRSVTSRRTKLDGAPLQRNQSGIGASATRGGGGGFCLSVCLAPDLDADRQQYWGQISLVKDPVTQAARLGPGSVCDDASGA
ncbi:hypothetical protein BaRGS_00003437 [Batillaria attramentaria]|uniref:Uncharacterized protein n=1 Tax=Batillaria attramentaria TaxID=370345 RepID=A0ABD0M169_9CAEN